MCTVACSRLSVCGGERKENCENEGNRGRERENSFSSKTPRLFFPSFFSPVPSPSLNLRNHLRFVVSSRWVCRIKTTREFSNEVIYQSLFGKGTRDRTRESKKSSLVISRFQKFRSDSCENWDTNTKGVCVMRDY